MTNEEAAALLDKWADEGLSDGFHKAATKGAAALRSAPPGGAAEMREAVAVPGMTLREHYAGLAMQGLVASGKIECDDTDSEFDECLAVEAKMTAQQAVVYADALLAALEDE